MRCTAADAALVLLVKPQFEAGRARVGKGGIVRDPDGTAPCCVRSRVGLESSGLFVVDVMVSPLRGADGNVKFLVRCNRSGPVVTIEVLENDACVDEARP